MDSPTYDPTTHLNKIFSSPDTLNELPQLLNHVSQYKRQLTEEINKSTAKYERVDLSEDISHLATSIGEIKRDSSMTKQSISQMTVMWTGRTGSGGIAGIVIFIFIVIVIFISLLSYGNKKSKRRNQKNTTPANITLGSLNLESQNVHQGVARIQQQQQQNSGITTSPEHDYVPPYTQTPNDNDLGRFDKQGNFHLSNRPEGVQPPLPPPPVYLNPTI